MYLKVLYNRLETAVYMIAEVIQEFDYLIKIK